METVHIVFSRDYTISEELTPNIRKYEFFVSSNPKKEWDCPVVLPLAAQRFRDWLNKKYNTNGQWPVIIYSSFRDRPGQLAHEEREAVDIHVGEHLLDENHTLAPITPYEVYLLHRHEVLEYLAGNGSELIDALREVGVTGFGLEPGCIHWDCGGYGLHKRINHHDKYGIYTIFEWDYNGTDRSI